MTEAKVKQIMKKLVISDDQYINSWFATTLESLGNRTPSEAVRDGDYAKVISIFTKLLPNGRPNEISPSQPENIKVPENPQDLI